MRTIVAILVTILFVAAPSVLMAKKDGKGDHKGHSPDPSDSAYEHADDRAKFKRGDDDTSMGKGHGKHDDMDEEQDRKKEKSRKDKKSKMDDESGDSMKKEKASKDHRKMNKTDKQGKGKSKKK
jgi:hypothetical protein